MVRMQRGKKKKKKNLECVCECSVRVCMWCPIYNISEVMVVRYTQQKFDNKCHMDAIQYSEVRSICHLLDRDYYSTINCARAAHKTQINTLAHFLPLMVE